MFNRFTVASIALSVMLVAPALADGDLAKQSQNPIGNMISLPLQNNTYFGVGPAEEWVNSFQAQPVIPVNLGKVNLINRAIIPYTYVAEQEGTLSGSGLFENESVTFESDSVSGLGNITYQGFISPAKPGKIIWGVGRLIKIGKQPIDFKIQPFWYAEAPDNGPEWSLQLQAKFLFPK